MSQQFVPESFGMCLTVPVPKDNNNLPTFTTGEIADKVLEINSGLVNKYGNKIGTEVRLSL